MISFLDDSTNLKLYKIFSELLGLSDREITIMTDELAISIINKLSFQERHGIGLFGSKNWNYKQDVVHISSIIIDHIILGK